MRCPACEAINQNRASRCFQCGLELPRQRWFQRSDISKLYLAGVGWILGLAALAVITMLFTLPRYKLYQQHLNGARESTVLANMRNLQVALMSFMVEDGRGFPTFQANDSTGEADPAEGSFKSMLGRLRNPLDKDSQAWAVSYRDPPFWKLYRPGQVVYVPLDIREGRATAFAIYGVGPSGLIKTVLRSQAYSDDGGSEQVPQELGQ